MITKNLLKDYANKLMFDMDEKEYETLEKEFEVILKQMDLIGEIKEIEGLEPMTFPFEKEGTHFREDVVKDTLSVEDVIANAKEISYEQVKVPKVVE